MCIAPAHSNISNDTTQIVSFSIDNLLSSAALASGLAQYGIVSHLLSLLGSPNLEIEDRLSVLLTLGHCTEASGETPSSYFKQQQKLSPAATLFLILRAHRDYLCYPNIFSQPCFLLSVEDHQSQLVQCGGLPLIITLLTEDTCEEVRKAATFILQTCKPASKFNYFTIIVASS